MNIRVFIKVLMVGAASMSLSASAFAGFKSLSVAQAHSLKVEVTSEQDLVAGAENFVGSLAQRAIGFLGDEKLTQKQRTHKFEKLLNDSFDMKTLGRFALGRYWRVSTKEQRKEYLALFREMVVAIYSDRFSDYGGQDLDVRNGRADGKRDVIVASFITSPKGPEIRLDWRVRYKDGRYKVIDVVVEGVSMAVTQRSDFASVIQRGGGEVSVLLAHLK